MNAKPKEASVRAGKERGVAAVPIYVGNYPRKPDQYQPRKQNKIINNMIEDWTNQETQVRSNYKL